MTQTEAPYNPNGVTLPSIVLMDYAVTRLQSPHELPEREKIFRVILFSTKFSLSSHRTFANGTETTTTIELN